MLQYIKCILQCYKPLIRLLLSVASVVMPLSCIPNAGYCDFSFFFPPRSVLKRSIHFIDIVKELAFSFINFFPSDIFWFSSSLISAHNSFHMPGEGLVCLSFSRFFKACSLCHYLRPFLFLCKHLLL